MNLTDWAAEISRRLLAEGLPQRWEHVQGVARQVAKVVPILGAADGDLVIAAALLHDIGYSRSLAKTGFHPLDGARYLVNLGADRRLCALVAHHSCAYREAELRGLTAELAEWVDEETELRDALWWADMSTTPDGKPTQIHDRIEEIQKRYGPEDLVTFFIRQAAPDLIAAAVRTEERMHAAGIDYTAK